MRTDISRESLSQMAFKISENKIMEENGNPQFLLTFWHRVALGGALKMAMKIWDHNVWKF